MKEVALDEWPAFHEKRMREVDALAKRDNYYRRDGPNARRLKDLSPAERDAIEADVTRRIAEQLSETPPYTVYFDAVKGWVCTCDKCNPSKRRQR